MTLCQQYSKINHKGEPTNVSDLQNHLSPHGRLCCRGAEEVHENDDARVRRDLHQV